MERWECRPSPFQSVLIPAATGTRFCDLHGSTAALATTLTLAAAINCIGIGFQRGTHPRWQLLANDGTGAPTLTDMGASFGIATGGVLTLFIAAPPNGSSIWVRVVDEVSGAVFEKEITADLPGATQFLSPRLFMNNGATAAAVAYDSAGVYLETEYLSCSDRISAVLRVWFNRAKKSRSAKTDKPRYADQPCGERGALQRNKRRTQG